MDAFRTQGFTRFAPDWRPEGVGDGASAAEPTGEHGSPPSSYAVLAVLDGQSGSVLRLIGLTLLRGCFIVPGIFIVSKVMKIELDIKELLALSFGGSATISAGMVGYYWVRRATGAIQ
jgi:hypothetical protein